MCQGTHHSPVSGTGSRYFLAPPLCRPRVTRLKSDRTSFFCNKRNQLLALTLTVSSGQSGGVGGKGRLGSVRGGGTYVRAYCTCHALVSPVCRSQSPLPPDFLAFHRLLFFLREFSPPKIDKMLTSGRCGFLTFIILAWRQVEWIEPPNSSRIPVDSSRIPHLGHRIAYAAGGAAFERDDTVGLDPCALR